MSRTRTLTAAATLAALLWAPALLAQDKPKDDLDRLLEGLDKPKEAEAKPKPGPKADAEKPKAEKKGPEQQADGGGPLSEVEKQMREVEQRLVKPDTGEETRNKQGEIVKKLDNVLQQLQRMRGQGNGSGRPRSVQAGNQPGSKPGQ